MRTIVYEWLGREFVALSAEGRASLDIAEQTHDIFKRCDQVLGGLGLSLANTVRTRLWGRDRESRDAGSQVRVSVLAGPARSASSSFIAPDYFESDAQVAVELWAMRPSQPRLQKRLVEYEPPIVPLRYLVYDGVVALSGVTSVLPTLDEQVSEILPRIQGSLADARLAWKDVARVSCLLHRSQPLGDFKSLLAQRLDVSPSLIEYGFADGYSTPGKLVEIEVTGKIPG